MSNNLPVLELIFITGDENEVDSTQVPTLTIFQYNDSYYIASGFEWIEAALAESFRHLGSRHHQALFMYVEVRHGNHWQSTFHNIRVNQPANRQRRKRQGNG